MKKLGILLLAVSAITYSCTPSASVPQANLKTDVDSLAYAVGAAQTQGLLPYLEQMGVDSAFVKEFVNGFAEGAQIEKGDKKKLAYVIGIGLGQQMTAQITEGLSRQLFGADTTKQLNKDNFIAGFVAGTLNKDLKMNRDSLQMYIEEKMKEVQNKQMEELYGENREAGVRFLEENKEKDGVVTLPSGLQYKILTKGNGAIPTMQSVVKVHYKGMLIDGTEFDSSHRSRTGMPAEFGEVPAEFGVGAVIRGWTEALLLMPVGSKWELYIPQELAYGSGGQGAIPPFSTLVFEVELVDIVE